jgi:hypothetical protein
MTKHDSTLTHKAALMMNFAVGLLVCIFQFLSLRRAISLHPAPPFTALTFDCS